MFEHVMLQVDLLDEALLAHLALKRPDAAVRLFVLLHLVLRLECLAAEAAKVAQRLLHLLVHRLDVVVEVGLLLVTLVTGGVVTGKRPLTYRQGQ